jgi:hypothetical protein
MRLEKTSGRGPGVVDQEQRTRPFRAGLVDVVEVLSAVASPSCVRTGIPGATPELRLGPLRGDVMSPGYRTERFLHVRLALPEMRFRPDGLHVRLRPDSYDIPCPFRSRITRVAGRPHNCGKGQPSRSPQGPTARTTDCERATRSRRASSATGRPEAKRPAARHGAVVLLRGRGAGSRRALTLKPGATARPRRSGTPARGCVRSRRARVCASRRGRVPPERTSGATRCGPPRPEADAAPAQGTGDILKT